MPIVNGPKGNKGELGYPGVDGPVGPKGVPGALRGALGGTNWINLGSLPAGMTTWQVPSDIYSIYITMAGGGGSGGNSISQKNNYNIVLGQYGGGGGGAAGVSSYAITDFTLAGRKFNFKVGSRGQHGANSDNGPGSGNNSYFWNDDLRIYLAAQGGYGATDSGYYSGGNGGNGGGYYEAGVYGGEGYGGAGGSGSSTIGAAGNTGGTPLYYPFSYGGGGGGGSLNVIDSPQSRGISGGSMLTPGNTNYGPAGASAFSNITYTGSYDATMADGAGGSGGQTLSPSVYKSDGSPGSNGFIIVSW